MLSSTHVRLSALVHVAVFFMRVAMYVDVFVCFRVHNHIFASMRARISEHIHTRVYTYICIYGFINRSARTRVCVNSHLYTRSQRYIETCIEKLIPKGVNRDIVHVYPLRECTCVCICVCICLCICVCLCVCICTFMHVCITYDFGIHVCIHPCTHVCACACLCRKTAAVFEIEIGVDGCARVRMCVRVRACVRVCV